MTPKFDIPLTVSINELKELISMYARRLGQYQTDVEYIHWNAERLLELADLVKIQDDENEDEDNRC